MRSDLSPLPIWLLRCADIWDACRCLRTSMSTGPWQALGTWHLLAQPQRINALSTSQIMIMSAQPVLHTGHHTSCASHICSAQPPNNAAQQQGAKPRTSPTSRGTFWAPWLCICCCPPTGSATTPPPAACTVPLLLVQHLHGKRPSRSRMLRDSQAAREMQRGGMTAPLTSPARTGERTTL